MATIASSAPSRAVRDRGKSFDRLMWQFMRLSGAALIPLALGHLAIMHLINNVHIMNTCFVYLRWSNLLWRIYDAGLLGFAMLHGLNGVRYSVDDYVHHPFWNKVLRWGLVVVGGAVFLAGAIALIGGVQIPAVTSLADPSCPK